MCVFVCVYDLLTTGLLRLSQVFCAVLMGKYAQCTHTLSPLQTDREHERESDL